MFELRLRFEKETRTDKSSAVVNHQSDYVPRVGDTYHIIDKDDKVHYGEVTHVEYTANQKPCGGYEIIFVVLKEIQN